MAGGVDDGRGAPVVDLERVVGRAGEQAGEVQEERRVGAGVAVDDLVVVAHAEHVEPGRGQQAEQQHVGRRQVLQLVDEQVAAPGLRLPPPLAVAQQELDGAVHLLVEVDGSGCRQPPAVRIERGGQAGDVVPLGLHLLRIAQPEAGQRQRLQVGTDGVGVEPAALGGHQLRDQPAHLALVQHTRRPARAPRSGGSSRAR